MLEWLATLSPVFQALTGTLFTWGVTALGAGLVFFFKSFNKTVLNGMLGFAAGVMIAASFWSLLAPAIETAESLGQTAWLTVAIGFLSGGLFLWLVDMTLPHLHMGLEKDKAEGIKTNWQRSVLLVLAITLHNIPEGLAVGIAFGAVASDLPSASLAGAVALALGIGLQNFPEGAAVSIPLRREGFSRTKAFLYGQASGIVEPIAGVIGAYAVASMQHVLPSALAFAAGAMIYVVVEELIPEAQYNEGGSSTNIGTIGCMIGFTVMMILDVALG
ncbi:ZIP family metal transporter [Acetonema longum]|uniref:Zinc transporter zip11 n=1 Tax=Acetonema longum DSM 6540 TaxID=1009370 RepID=F7NE90_9FIRM|nr:ZIP family metal transporter [Acetonema longum]EGO65602.1 zinc transporter zip11 [Acetonema longum DSM 6540]